MIQQSNTLDVLFRFPVVMVDGHKEEEKEREIQRLALDNKPHEVDIIIGEAECPYYDFISVTDRWLPTEESFQKALRGKFDACSVLFSHSGSYVVPWPRDKFKRELKKFTDQITESDKATNMSRKELIDFLREEQEKEEDIDDE